MEPMSRMECMKLLMQCMDLFQPEYYEFYAQFSPEGKFSMELWVPNRTPDWFPRDYRQMEEMSGRIYSAMLSLELPERYLAYPDFEELTKRLDALCFEECAQYLLFWCRANLKYGQEFFYQTWREGKALRVLRRMATQLDAYRFPEERPVETASIELELGDLTAAKADCVVNPTDEQFSGSGGVDRLVHKKAGSRLREACKKIGQLPAGHAVVTAGFDLPAAQIIHVSIPTRGQEDTPYLLASCYAGALHLAQSRWERTVVFPAMGSGSAGIAPEEALRIGAETLWSWTRQNPGRPMTVKVLFTSAEKLEIFRKALMRCIVRDFRAAADPAHMGARMRHSLPELLEERGGLAQLSPERKAHADLGRDAMQRLHEQYSELMLQLYRLIGEPDYGSVIQSAMQRVSPKGGCGPVKGFVEHLQEMGLEECICWLVFLQRMDYGSGGTAGTQIRSCANGSVLRVLDHMEQLLKP